MTRSKIGDLALATLLVPIALAAGCWGGEKDVAATSSEMPAAIAAADAGLLYGRVTADDGEIYEGRLRWGGDEEALWGNYFNGFKTENPWVGYAPPERVSIEMFGIEIGARNRQREPGRPFMARLGDIALIEPQGRKIRVVLKSGTEFVLNRYSADDLADGVRIWDGKGDFVDLGEKQIRSIELLPTARLSDAPYPLHGTVRTTQGDFTGLIQWNRKQNVGPDELKGHTGDGDVSLRFDGIRSIARAGGDGSVVTLLDGREIELADSRDVDTGNSGIYVDDQRYGRVLISWDAFEHVDFSRGSTGPAYDDFSPGQPLRGSVITRSGRRLTGQLVYDLDESETIETLDAPSQGVDYTILFGLVASIAPNGGEERGDPRARVILHSGEVLQLERAGDLGDGNGGMLVFFDARRPPEYVPWSDVERIDFDRPTGISPPTAAP
jgi:hypothetical protein